MNITIEDRGWVDRVTGGDRRKDQRATRLNEAEILAEVDKIRSIMILAFAPWRDQVGN